MSLLRQTDDPVESLSWVKENGEAFYFPLKALNLYREELKHFAEVVIKGIPPSIPAEISLKNQSVIDAAYQSLSEKGALSELI